MVRLRCANCNRIVSETKAIKIQGWKDEYERSTKPLWFYPEGYIFCNYTCYLEHVREIERWIRDSEREAFLENAADTLTEGQLAEAMYNPDDFFGDVE